MSIKKEECKPIVINIIDQLSHHIPIVELMDYLITDICDIQNSSNSDWVEFMSQVFIKSTSFTRQDRIIALELIGASLLIFLGCRRYNHVHVVGLQCWREAMNLRYFPTEGEPLLPKTPDVCVPSAASSAVFGSAVEVMTMEELNLLQEDFERYCLTTVNHFMRLPCIQRMQIQALLVIRRISTQSNIGHNFRLYLINLRSFGAFFMLYMQITNHQGVSLDSKIVINTFLLILERASVFDQHIHLRKLFDVFVSTLWVIPTFFFTTLKKPLGSPEREELSYSNFLAPTKFITTIQWDHFDTNENRLCFTKLVTDYLFILDEISPQMTSEEKQNLEEYYSSYIRHFFPSRTTTFLHVAVGRKIGNNENYVMLPSIKLILKLGADPNATDEDGRTPLHILAGVKSLHLEGYLFVFKALVDAGSHLDMARDDGETVLSILKRNVIECKHDGPIIDPYFESVINTVFPLSCYAARVIRRLGIRCDEDRLPVHLQQFVKRHSAKGFSD